MQDGPQASQVSVSSSLPIFITRFPGVVAVEVNEPSGRFVWFSTLSTFDVSNGKKYPRLFKGEGVGILRHGFYENHLPGEENIPGWNFSLAVHNQLSDIGGVTFKVTRPYNFAGRKPFTFFTLSPERIFNDMLEELGFPSKGTIPEELWLTPQLPERIGEFVKTQAERFSKRKP
ncbi:MAG: hypothetical protein UT86_C0001G0068 [Candidatus Magasanikbacteria bacterium GW2011_GWC2_40_17]|uniref:Uncharacterized protein n=1 Tax=Candidatus Magasanikbacteria bacterium GW2011_GWA2_42_32 TaxID=1619039 RepID=A0A0G1D5U5_9BACT|nr:MAG: hypothetical protein UT86_C0001G0068 [Candidatus Magasanikbacteria bacterium GW2011_GWC2_40_17]KKS57428.1 MAG: hypothetical protein UV20_C0001G0068 [Candidatus Magasanikbacteria bacterium GW2011_GWA2_42_32]